MNPRAAIEARFEALDPVARVHWHGLALCLAVYLVHYALYSWWYIEDAAISFAFANHVAIGEGPVAVPGGEVVEGFSNPSWTLLLAALRVVGISPWIAAKLLGAAFGALTLPAALWWARRAIGPDARLTPLIAPLLLATAPQFVIWNASGLENSLFVVLLAWGAAGVLDEVDRPGERWPWSAAAWVLLAVTRPEAPMYAAVAGSLGLVLGVARNGVGPTVGWALRWGLTFLVPFAAWHAARYAVFGWPFPNTYYAKLDDVKKFQPFGWYVKGWSYLRAYALASGMGFVLPIFALAATGLRGWRVWIGVIAVAVGFVLVLPGLWWPSVLVTWPPVEEPEWWNQARVVFLAAAVVALPLVGSGREGQGARLLAWALGGCALFFALYSGGDWMKGHRWLSMAIVPIAVLFADAVHAMAAAVASLGTRGGAKLVAGALVATPIVTGAITTGRLLSFPETMPYDVGRRVVYMQGVQDRLHLDHVTLMDVDMGAHLWWSGFDVVDMAGLVDVPMAQHKWQKPFVKQYVYEERNPDFAHVHGSWASKTRMTTHPEWRRYLEIEPYPISPWTQHPGNHVRKDLFVVDEWPGTDARRASFANGLDLVGLDVPAPEVAQGGSLYVEIGLRRRTRPTDLRVLLFLAGPDGLVVEDLPPGYDWYRPTMWKKTEVVLGRHSVSLPEDLPPGTYDLGVVVVTSGADGKVVPATQAEGGTLADPRFAEGEARWVGAVTVRPRAEIVALADDGVAETARLADAGDCDGAEARWTRARRHLDRHDPWQADARPRVAGPLARCWAVRAETAPEADQVEPILAGRRWDRDHPDVRRVGAAIADRLVVQGERAAEGGDWGAAYAAWRDALRIEPTRAHLRKRAEEARDRTLGLVASVPDPDAPAEVVEGDR